MQDFHLHSTKDSVLLRESVSLECKPATGWEAKGLRPEDFWPTYRAFASTAGAGVLLGVGERKEFFETAGRTVPPAWYRSPASVINTTPVTPRKRGIQ